MGPLRLNLTVTDMADGYNAYPTTTVSQINVASGRQAKVSARYDFRVPDAVRAILCGEWRAQN